MKDSFYFPHDYHARFDPKLIRLRAEIGPVGDGLYWDIVEMLYEEGGYGFLKDIPLIAKTYNTTEELVNKVVKDSKLFVVNGEKFYSESLLNRLKHINTKRRKARCSAKLSHSANAERTQSERSAIKERKGKERKGNERREEPRTEIATLSLKTSFLETLKNLYPKINIEAEIKACVVWWARNGRTMKDPASAVSNWLKKCSDNPVLISKTEPQSKIKPL